MTAAGPPVGLDIYQHDGPNMFRFVLSGALSGTPVRSLEYSWITASSILGAKELVVDIAGLVHADTGGLELLSRMRSSGARLVAGRTPANTELARALDVPIAAPATWFNLRKARWTHVFQQWLAGLRHLSRCLRPG